jgi:CRP-like cAMP-binding protein
MVSLLKAVRIFEDCTTQELEDIATICEQVSFNTGERLFEANSPAEHLFLVVKGLIELHFNVTHYSAAKKITFERVKQGEILGWSSALTQPRVYALSATAVKDSELLRIRVSDIEKLCMENNHLGYVLMKNISETIAARFNRLQHLFIAEIQYELNQKELSR